MRPDAVTGMAHAAAPAGGSTWTAAGSGAYGYDAADDMSGTPSLAMTSNPMGRLSSIKVTSSGQAEKRIYDGHRRRWRWLLRYQWVRGTLGE